MTAHNSPAAASIPPQRGAQPDDKEAIRRASPSPWDITRPPVDYPRPYRMVGPIPPHIIQQAHDADWARNVYREMPETSWVVKAFGGGLVFAVIFGLAVFL